MRRHKFSQVVVLCSKIVLAVAEGLVNVDIAERLGCSAKTVSKWRRKFVEFGLDGLRWCLCVLVGRVLGRVEMVYELVKKTSTKKLSRRCDAVVC